ncbi:MAG: ABC transporter permease [Paramuribaculum sp.]|nr:ABC transporter permease [Paramuribaculum sp.]
MSQTSLIIEREFYERVRKKSFLITTIALPVLMVAMMIIPTLLMVYGGKTDRTIYISDPDYIVGPALIAAQSDNDDDEIKFILSSLAVDSLINIESADGVLEIPAGLIDSDKPLKLYTNGSSSMALESAIEKSVEQIVEKERLKRYNIENLSEILKQVTPNLTISSTRTDSDKEQSAAVSYFLGFALTFVLYMFLMLYGQMVMTSIIEEKNNRVLEIVVSSVSPTKLMLGKIAGIGLVAVTQIVIWAGLLILFSAILLPAILPAEIAGEVAAVNSGSLDIAQASIDSDIMAALSIFTDPGYIISTFAVLTLYLVLGFLFYAAIFAAIGSAVDNIQDASQLQSVSLVPIILGLVFGMTAATEPSSAMAFWSSIIPFTSPMVMMARIPYGVPAWEIIVSLVLLIAGVAAIVWFAAKIYRIGIFMYGKKPTVKDLIKWARYK